MPTGADGLTMLRCWQVMVSNFLSVEALKVLGLR